jgi:demethylmenaquinone methyltransferase/2-methoxy-6-polyprenyl-1,4-benzoquinol methylase
MDDDRLLDDQQTFYRKRAPEYDEWWERRGRYDRGPEAAADWQVQVAEMDRALAAFGATGNVLELAGGTGWWTQRLADTAGVLTVVDGSPETLALNRQRVGRSDVTYVLADLFRWEPARNHAHDVVFFSFWLSHVPRRRFDDFWRLVRRCLAPGGRVFLMDNRHDPGLTVPDPYVFAEGEDVQRRRLNDGSEHRVVKVFYEPEDLTSRLAAIGWKAEIQATRWFVFGSAAPAS